MNTTAAPLTPEALFAAYNKRAILMALVGDFAGCAALRVSHLVWSQAPAIFPDFAATLVESDSPRGALWDTMHLAAEIPGAWDLYVATRDALAGAL